MEIIAYFYIAAGLFFLWCWGRVFIKMDLFSSLFTGLLVAGGILAVTARFIPLYSRELVGLMAGIGVVVLLVDFRKNKLHIKWDKFLLPAIVFIAIFFRYMHFQNWDYSAEDIIHDSPALEMLSADYIGNLRLFYYYPYEMAASHILHAAVSAAIAFLYPHPNLILVKEISYILVVLFFANFIVQFFRICQMQLTHYLLTLICCFGIFGLEIGFQLTFTSLLYVLVLLQLLILFFKKGFFRQELLFFSMMLIVTRAPIFYIGGILACYLWVRYKDYRFTPLTIFTSVIVVANIFSWIIIPPPFGVNVSFDILNPFNPKLGLAGFFGLSGWILPDNFVTLLMPELWLDGSFYSLGKVGKEASLLSLIQYYFPQVIAIICLLVYIVIKYYATFFVAHYFSNGKVVIDAFFIYMIISLLGFLIVRNGGSISQQVHAFWAASVVSFAYVLIVVSKERKILLGLVPIALFYWYGYNPTQIPTWYKTPDPPQATFESHPWPDRRDGFYLPKPHEILSRHMELKAMMTGLRLRARDALGIVPLQTQKFVLTNEPRFNITLSALNKLKSAGVPNDVLKKIAPKKAVNVSSGYLVVGEDNFVTLLNILLGKEVTGQFKSQIMLHTLQGKF